MPTSDRKQNSITEEDINEKMVSIINSNNKDSKFIGAHFETVDLSNINIDHVHGDVIDFRHAKVKEFNFSGSTFDMPITLSGCSLDHIRAKDTVFNQRLIINGIDEGEKFVFDRTTFKNNVQFENSSINGEFSSIGAFFEQKADFNRVSFLCPIYFNRSTFDDEVVFSECIFNPENKLRENESSQMQISFHSAIFKDYVRFIDGELRDRMDLRGSEIDRLSFMNTKFFEVFVGAAKIKSISWHGIPINKSGYISLSNSEIDDGFLSQPTEISDGEIIPLESSNYYRLAEATIGDISISTTTNDFSCFFFFNTKFDGFDFADYYEELAPNWSLEEYSGPHIQLVTGDRKSETRRSQNPTKTYSKARNGAQKVADRKSESMFLRKEMRSKRGRYSSVANRGEISEQIKIHYRYIVNLLYDLTCGYGENAKKAVSTSILTIVIFSLVYPSVGGVIDPSGKVISGYDNIVSEYGIYLYFSMVTFSTIGPSGYQPNGYLSQMLTGIESLTGVALSALLIFVLGRKVSK